MKKDMNKRTLFVAISILAILSISCTNSIVYASEDRYAFSKIRLNGYGTMSYTNDDNDNILPIRDLITSSGVESEADLKKNSNFRMDSLLGIQADYRFSQQLEFVIQGVLKDRADPSFADSIEAAYLGFRPLPIMDIRAGRFSYDAFLMSDIRNTGYAYLWVRPPIEFYGRIPIYFVDGADIAYNFNDENAKWRIKFQAGTCTSEMATTREIFEFKVNDLWTLSLSRQSGPLRFKAAYSQMMSVNEFSFTDFLHHGLNKIAADTAEFFPDISKEAISLKNDIAFKDNKLTYSTLSAEYDDGKWVAQAEISRITASRDILPNGDAAYLSLGYRFGDFTPYCIFSSIKPGTDQHKPMTSWDIIGQEELHSQLIHEMNSTRMEQYTHSLGLRWDFHNQAALKLQFDNTHIKPYGYGLWWHGHDIEDLTAASSVNLYSLSMEFIF